MGTASSSLFGHPCRRCHLGAFLYLRRGAGSRTSALLPQCIATLLSVGNWSDGTTGVVVLPDGRIVRGRGLGNNLSKESVHPEFALYLTAKPPEPAEWESRWVRWPDFRLPHSSEEALDALKQAHDRAEFERVEIACNGGTGRTGTAIAILARMAGVPGSEATRWTRTHYRRHAVETPWQRRFVTSADLAR